jgi:hypothetical protein
MPTVPDIHRRGTRAAQATLAAPPLTVGTLYFVTDEGVTERWTGSAWESYSGPPGGGPPPAHHATHETGGADAIAALAASVITTGTIAAARLPPRIGAVGLVIDGGGAVITTGVKGDLYVPFACTITASTLIADQAGSVVLNVLLSASYATTPTASIVASAPPTLAAAAAAQDTTLAGWAVSVAAGSRLRVTVTSASTITRLGLTLTVQA